MKGTRHQEGYLYRKGSLWLLRYYDSEFAADGSGRRIQKTKKLAAVGPECPSKNRCSKPREAVPRIDQPRTEHT